MPAPYSLDLRRRVVAALLTGGRTQAEVARQFSVALSTAEDWLHRYRATGSLEPTAQRHGPPRSLSEADDARIAAYLDPERGGENDLTLAEVADRFAADTGRSVGEMTLFRSLVRSEVTRKKRRSTPRSG